MAEPVVCADVRRLLVATGARATSIDRVVAELRDHWEETRTSALTRGALASDAVAEADVRLGCPAQIATRVIAQWRRRSWLWRHPLVAWLGMSSLFFVSPLIAILAVLVGFDEGTRWAGWEFGGSQSNGAVLVGLFWVTYCLVMIGVPALFCRLMRGAAIGGRWTTAVWVMSAAVALPRVVTDATAQNINIEFMVAPPFTIQVMSILALHVIAGTAEAITVGRPARTWPTLDADAKGER